jgi:hypothetical protein
MFFLGGGGGGGVLEFPTKIEKEKRFKTKQNLNYVTHALPKYSKTITTKVLLFLLFILRLYSHTIENIIQQLTDSIASRSFGHIPLFL